MSDLISRKDLVETLEPFLEEHCSKYVTEMVIAKIEYVPDVTTTLEEKAKEYETNYKQNKEKEPFLALIDFEKASAIREVMDIIGEAGGVTDGSKSK